MKTKSPKLFNFCSSGLLYMEPSPMMCAKPCTATPLSASVGKIWKMKKKKGNDEKQKKGPQRCGTKTGQLSPTSVKP